MDLVIDETALEAKLEAADIVVTGEGRVDEQTGYGKTALGVGVGLAGGVPVAVGVAVIGSLAFAWWRISVEVVREYKDSEEKSEEKRLKQVGGG